MAASWQLCGTPCPLGDVRALIEDSAGSAFAAQFGHFSLNSEAIEVG